MIMPFPRSDKQEEGCSDYTGLPKSYETMLQTTRIYAERMVVVEAVYRAKCCPLAYFVFPMHCIDDDTDSAQGHRTDAVFQRG